MRVLILIWLLACSPAILADNPLSDCVAITSPSARLACYDRLAHRKTQKSTARDSMARDTGAQQTSPPAESTIQIPEKPHRQSADLPRTQSFGEQGADVDEGDSIDATLVSAHRNGRRLYVLKLNNGQVWMQREAGDRPIRGDQPVTITRKRWSYGMLLEDQNFEVTVQRIR